MLDYILNIDKRLFLILNGTHSSFFDPIMVFASKEFVWIPLYVALCIYIFIKHKIKGILIVALIILAVVSADIFASWLMKPYFQRLRPCHNLEIQSLIHLPSGRCGGQFGFISSHAANTFCLAMFCGLLFIKKNKAFSLFFVWAFVITYSRIYLGVHYPLDVFLGSMSGMLIAYFYFKLLSFILNFKFNKLIK